MVEKGESHLPDPDFTNPTFQQALRDLNQFERDNPGWIDDPQTNLGHTYSMLFDAAQKASGLDIDDYEVWEAQAY